MSRMKIPHDASYITPLGLTDRDKRAEKLTFSYGGRLGSVGANSSGKSGSSHCRLSPEVACRCWNCDSRDDKGINNCRMLRCRDFGSGYSNSWGHRYGGISHNLCSVEGGRADWDRCCKSRVVSKQKHVDEAVFLNQEVGKLGRHTRCHSA